MTERQGIRFAVMTKQSNIDAGCNRIPAGG